MISARCIKGTPYDLTTKLNGKSFFPKGGSSLLFFNFKHPPKPICHATVQIDFRNTFGTKQRPLFRA